MTSSDSGDGSDKKSPKWRDALMAVVLGVAVVVVGSLSGWLMVRHVSQTAVAAYKAEQAAKGPVSGPYAGDIELRSVPPVVTNLASSDEDWIRVETSVIMDRTNVKDPALVISRFRQDMLTFLRTVRLGQIQGPSGLVHLRDDLNERARISSGGLIKEVVLETLIIQ